MIDHTSIAVKNYSESLEFYDKTLSTLGYTRLMTLDKPEFKMAGYGNAKRQRPYFWISSVGREDEEVGKARGFHLSFEANSVEEIHHWYETCLKLGGKDNGAPGTRPHYHPGYYGAFITDPNGWRIEACFHYYNE